MMLACFVVILVLNSAQTLQCPPGISSFAAESGNSYYKCSHGEAVHSTCATGTLCSVGLEQTYVTALDV